MARPSKYDPSYSDKLLEHMKEGLSFKSFGAIVGVCEDTLFEWCKVHPEFSESKKVGETFASFYWEKLGIQAANGAIENFNSTVWIFTMKNRCGWRDKADLRLGNEEGKSFKIDHSSVQAILSDDETSEALDQILSRIDASQNPTP